MMKIEDLCITKETLLLEAMRRLDQARGTILLVVEDGVLIGVVTDGDIRRWLIRKGDLNTTVSEVMHLSPRFVYEGMEQKSAEMLHRYCLDAIPVLNERNQPVDVIFREGLASPVLQREEQTDAPVVIMAGGRGTRLDPYTRVLPKPLIPIGNRTILERIMGSFQKYGCSDFYFTLNYKKELIKAYLNELEHTDQFHYLEENGFYGTAGSLSLLKDVLDKPFFVSNCDIILNVNYAKLMSYHLEKRSRLTVVTAAKNFQVPYGVTETDENGYVVGIQEKPALLFQIIAGVYVMDPAVLKEIPQDNPYQMPQLIEAELERGYRVGVYPITEGAWQDMGQLEEMEQMRSSYEQMDKELG